MPDLLCAVFRFSPKHRDRVHGSLYDAGIHSFVEGVMTPEGTVDEDAAVTLYVEDETVAAKLRAYLESELGSGIPVTLEISTLENQAWESEWQKYWEPTEVSPRLCVCPSWIPYQAKSGQRVMRIDPAMAFGTGTHPTTRLCLQVIEDLVPASGISRVLDFGCGTGVLSIAALMFGAREAVGLDVNPAAVEQSTLNAALNNVSGASFGGGGLDTVSGLFDLVCANILSPVLLEHLDSLRRRVSPGGSLLLSGITSDEVGEFLAAARIEPAEQRELEGWVALLMRE